MTRVSFFVAAAAVALLGDLASAQDAPRGDAAKGRDLYLAIGCSNCHGTVGQGARGIVRLSQPRPMPYGAYLSQLRQPTGDMPPYVEAVVPAQAAADIYAFIQTLPQPADVRSIPLLAN
jgi:mono/diheme cytochrome c family protein